MPDTIFHALVLNLHQPSGNLEHLLEHNEWEAREILWALDRMPRSLWQDEDIARVHLSLSGTLLETISNPAFQERVYGITKLGDFIWHLQNTKIFEILGTGFYHPVFPLTPEADWDEQMIRWQGIGRHLFWRPSFGGFWPPEMGFCMEMIPHLRRMGYRYVLVDSNHVDPLVPMKWEEIRYQPHTASFGGEEITIVVRDRELSDAQESGLDYGWFAREVNDRTRHCDFAPLVTMCTDGENGGWFRNTSANGNFWDCFYREFASKVRSKESNIKPVFISEYLDKHGIGGPVKVNTGAWNTGWHHGTGFLQWTGSQAQKDAFARIARLSALFDDHRIKTARHPENPATAAHLREAHWHLLRAETSCNFFWGEAWVGKAHEDLDAVERELKEMPGDRAAMPSVSPDQSAPDPAPAPPPVTPASPTPGL